MSKTHLRPVAAPATAVAPVTVTKSVELAFVKSTPGTHVYGTENKDAVCRQVYLSKSAMGETAPTKITLSVTFG